MYVYAYVCYTCIIHTCTCIHIYAYIHMHTYVYIHIHAYTYAHIYTYLHTYIYSLGDSNTVKVENHSIDHWFPNLSAL